MHLPCVNSVYVFEYKSLLNLFVDQANKNKE